MFNAGIRPAINAGLSVSRVGGAAQTQIVKRLAGGIRIAIAQYIELEAFSQFASDLDEATRKQLERGQRIMETLKQRQYAPLSVAEIALSWFAVDRGFVDDVELHKVGAFEDALQSYAKAEHADFLSEINETPKLTDEVSAQLIQLVETFKSTQSW